jgi:hypothetical protein
MLVDLILIELKMDDFNTTLQDFDFQSNNTNTSSRGTLTSVPDALTFTAENSQQISTFPCHSGVPCDFHRQYHECYYKVCNGQMKNKQINPRFYMAVSK